MTTVKFQRETTPKKVLLWFLWSAHRMIMLYICMTFHDTILNDFQVKEQIGNYHCQISKGNNSKMYGQVLRFL